MSHKFSNTSRIRTRVAATPPRITKWEQFPVEVRIFLLEYILILLEEALFEAAH